MPAGNAPSPRATIKEFNKSEGLKEIKLPLEVRRHLRVLSASTLYDCIELCLDRPRHGKRDKEEGFLLCDV